MGAGDYSLRFDVQIDCGVLSRGRCVKLTSYLKLLPRLRVSGAVPLFPLHAFVAWTGKTFLVALPLPKIIHGRSLVGWRCGNCGERERERERDE